MAVDAAPARLEGDLAARPEALVFDEGDDRRPRIPRPRVEHGEEAPGDQIEDAPFVGRELRHVVLDVGRDDRVVVVDARVIDDAAERELPEGEHVARGVGVLGDRDERLGRGLELRDEIAGEEARRGPRIRDRLLALVERLGRLQRPPRREAEAAVRVALEGREVVEERRALGLLLALDRLDLAVLAGDPCDDVVRAPGLLDPGLVALEPQAVIRWLERCANEPVRLRYESLDLALALHDHRERRRLDASERDDAADPSAAADRRRPGRVHADEPVGLGTRTRRCLERGELVARPQPLEALLDRLLRHRGDPEPVDRLLRAGRLVDVGEDELALAACVAGVDDAIDVGASEELADRGELLLRLRVARLELEGLGDDGQVGHAPLLQPLVVVLGLGELHEVADGPGDDVLLRLEVRLVLLEAARERGREVAADGRLLGDDERLAHGRDTLAKACRDPAKASVNTPHVPERMSRIYLLVAAVSLPVVRFVFRLRATGLEHVPTEGGFVLAANHTSNFDPWPLGLPLFPQRWLRFMAKSELYWWPLGVMLDAVGAFPVERGRGDLQAIAKAVELVRAGEVVVMFPEGTRQRKGLRKRWEARPHTGAARIARQAGAPLVPAAIKGTDRLARLGPLRVAYGPPVEVSDDSRETTERLMAEIQRLYETL